MSIDIETNHLYKQINRKLNLTVSEHLNTSAGYIIYTNRKFIDPKEKRIIIYYYPCQEDPKARKIGDYINIGGSTYSIQFWEAQKPTILEGKELQDFYDSHKRKD